jgi:similar to stage IV sporulation protein
MIGLVGGVFFLVLGSFFIWDFEVTGNDTVPEERILRALEQQGVGIGTFGLSFNGEDLRNHILLEIPELSWIAVNVSGCRANVQVRERVMPPELIRDKDPANVVARRAGLVLNVRALDGVASVLPGTSVTKGQLLISGVEDLETLGARVLASLGSVQARTWYELSAEVPLTAREKQYTGKEKRGISLIVGKQRLKFFSNSSIEGAKYDKITNNYSGSVLGIPLPVKLSLETWKFYKTAPVQLDPVRAEKMGERILTEYLQTFVEPYGTVRSTLCSARQNGNVLEVTLHAECVEEIGEAIPILTEELGKP